MTPSAIRNPQSAMLSADLLETIVAATRRIVERSADAGADRGAGRAGGGDAVAGGTVSGGAGGAPAAST